MKLIVGLGNPGKKYEGTRHNVGFSFIDSLSNSDKYKEKFNGLYLKKNLYEEDVVFVKPLSYMNLSGKVVRDFMNFYKINSEDILVISDDLDMPTGKIKTKFSGSSGGHNGLKDIEKNIGTNNYKRFKIGISNTNKSNVIDFVLGKFSKEEEEVLNKIYSKSNEIVKDFLVLKFDNFMNKYNKR